MNVRAEYDAKYFRRFLFISLGCLIFAGWCFYDALVKYPAELERANVYWTLDPEKGEKYVAMERTEWREVVKKNQWPTEAPNKPKQLLVEFHHRIPGVGTPKTAAIIDRLREAGYRIFAVSNTGREVSFMHMPD